MSTQEKDADIEVGQADRSPQAAEAGAFLGFIGKSGEIFDFAWDAVRRIPHVLRHEMPEVLRQASYMVRSHLGIILLLAGMMGAMLAIIGAFVFASIGLETYVAIIIAIPMIRGVLAVVFGWVFAAKAGCGIVAELGAMRISEEIDALEVMGVPPMPYLVATRLAASLLVLPAMYTAALLVHFEVAQFFFTHFLKSVSSGGYEAVFYSLQGPRDFVFTVVAGTVVGFIVTLSACYFGFTASGGPVGVGRSTAQSMLVNLVLIGLAVMILVQAFYGGSLAAPVGN